MTTGINQTNYVNTNLNTNTTGSGSGTAKKASETDSTEKSASTGSALKSLNANFDMFLKLLTVQMKNQDPLKPQDPNEMTDKLVSFANVEQNIATNKKLDQLIALQDGGRTSTALSYIGRTVEVESDKMALQGGRGSFTYTLQTEAKSVRIDLLDSTGKKVRELTGETGAGPHALNWDGMDNQGNALPDGVYTINMATRDKEENSVKYDLAIYGTVSGVDMTGSVDKLNIGLLEVDMDKVRSVMQ
ncbi:MAG TPA: flagellar hook assembly protein FlgD [Azospirillaceae bacterium]|nr:flagellar hook assembly protein FlgD [Azospirillaceae bacterium]